MSDVGALQRFLGSLPEWQAGLTAFGAVVATIVGAAWPVVRAVRKQRALDLAEADKPSVPEPARQTAMPPDVLEALRAMTEWSTAEMRARIGQLERLEVLLRNEIASLRLDLEDSNAENLRLSAAMASTNGLIETLAREREAADLRAQHAIAELREQKWEAASGRHASAAITPLRPPRGD